MAEDEKIINPDVPDEDTDDDPAAEIENPVEEIMRLGVQLGSDAENDDDIEIPEIPDELPILPLRGLVVYPQTAIPLVVGQQRSIKLVDDIMAGDRIVGLVASKDPELEEPSPDEIYRVGTLASIHRLFRAPDGTIRLLVQGLQRIEVDEFTAEQPFLRATAHAIPETIEEDALQIEAATRNVTDLFSRLADLVPSIPGELISSMLNTDDPLHLVYSIATYIRIDLEEAQELLELPTLGEKLRRLIQILSKEVEVLELGRKIQSDAKAEMEKMQRDYFLREQMKAIQRELGEADDPTG